jgi:low temperature requirement protein LtrA
VQRVTNIELFFDLVYVFAITQLSHYVSWPRVAGIVVLALLGLAATAIPELGLAACAAGVVTAVAASDRVPGLHPPG